MSTTHDSDTDDGVLTLILIAPMVVASWINLQYFGSTVDNHIFGCGNKTLHNRVGGLGVSSSATAATCAPVSPGSPCTHRTAAGSTSRCACRW